MNFYFKASILSVYLGLAGCAAGPHTLIISDMVGDTHRPPALMQDVNVAMTVMADEGHRSKVPKAMRVELYLAGLREGAPAERYRYIVGISYRLEHGSLLWRDRASLPHVAGAMVPDHIGALKAGDVVEMRSVATRDALPNFHRDGEGQIVTRVICRKASPDWKNCFLNVAPRFGKNGKYVASGQTGTPFLASVKDYGFTFSEFYDDEGNRVRELPKP